MVDARIQSSYCTSIYRTVRYALYRYALLSACWIERYPALLLVRSVPPYFRRRDAACSMLDSSIDKNLPLLLTVSLDEVMVAWDVAIFTASCSPYGETGLARHIPPDAVLISKRA